MSTLPTEADALALELVEASGQPERVIAIAARLAALAARLRDREAAPCSHALGPVRGVGKADDVPLSLRASFARQRHARRGGAA
jgi:hypothetical protein